MVFHCGLIVPKNRPAVFALAAAFAHGSPATVQAAKGAFTEVVRTTDHLSMFFGYDKQPEGKRTPQGTAPVTGRALRMALGSWFLVPEVNRVAWKACKARQRVTPAQVQPEARVVVAAMAANGYAIGEPRDAGVLAVAGMDASLPKVMSAFIR